MFPRPHCWCGLKFVVEEVLQNPGISYEHYSPLKLKGRQTTLSPSDAITITSSSSSGSGSNQKGKANRVHDEDDIFGAVGGSPSTWRGSQPVAATSKGNLFAAQQDLSGPGVAGPSKAKWYRNFRYSGYSLPHPAPDSFGSYEKALDAWTPPRGSALRLSPIAYQIPDRGVSVADIEAEILSHDGIAAREFWNLWERCAACEKIVFGPKMSLHICDLTEL
ncbi:hypothetical protein HWV62_20612 [Athelia sp. TMB]|nr:hypothetical protein HWV62_20612 [Athelia sp. TMB]